MRLAARCSGSAVLCICCGADFLLLGLCGLTDAGLFESHIDPAIINAATIIVIGILFFSIKSFIIVANA
jgi:hypothetical protein